MDTKIAVSFILVVGLLIVGVVGASLLLHFLKLRASKSESGAAEIADLRDEVARLRVELAQLREMLADRESGLGGRPDEGITVKPL
jgi:hypothetical protein